MNNILIERGIPPPQRKPRGFWHKLLKAMQPGDSFLVDGYGQRTCVRKAAEALGLRVTTAKEHAKGVRIWRL